MKDHSLSRWSVNCRERDMTEHRVSNVVECNYRFICVVTKQPGGIQGTLQIQFLSIVSIEVSSSCCQ